MPENNIYICKGNDGSMFALYAHGKLKGNCNYYKFPIQDKAKSYFTKCPYGYISNVSHEKANHDFRIVYMYKRTDYVKANVNGQKCVQNV